MRAILLQPARLRVPTATRTKFRVLFILDVAFIALGIAAVLVGLGPAREALPGGAGVLIAGLGAFFGLPGVIGLASGLPMLRGIDRVELEGAPLLWARDDDGLVILAPGTRPRRSRIVAAPAGTSVAVHVGPDLGASLFYVVVALKWTIVSPYGSASFRTFFEPDPQFFEDVRLAIESVGVQATFTYRPLSHGFIVQDM